MPIYLILLFTFVFAAAPVPGPWILSPGQQGNAELCPEQAEVKRLPKGGLLFGTRIYFPSEENKKWKETEADSGCQVDWNVKVTTNPKLAFIEQSSHYSKCKDRKLDRRIQEKLSWTAGSLIYEIQQEGKLSSCSYTEQRK